MVNYFTQENGKVDFLSRSTWSDVVLIPPFSLIFMGKTWKGGKENNKNDLLANDHCRVSKLCVEVAIDQCAVVEEGLGGLCGGRWRRFGTRLAD